MIDRDNRKPSWVVILFLILSACSSIRHLIYSEKSGLQQLLVSKAIEGALQGAALDIEESKIFVEMASLTWEEDAYFKKAVSHWLLKKKALLPREKREADPPPAQEIRGEHFTLQLSDLKVTRTIDRSTKELTTAPYPRGRIKISNVSNSTLDIHGVTIHISVPLGILS
jgi:hypothetical protein